MLKPRPTISIWVVAGALALCFLQLMWFNWRFQRQNERLQQDIEFLKAEICHLQSQEIPNAQAVSSNEDQLYAALARLGDKNMLTRYQAAMTVRRYEKRAVPELVRLLNEADKRSRESAVILLGQMDCDSVLSDLRQYVDDFLQHPQQEDADEKLAAAIIGILAKEKDEGALQIFKKAFHYDSTAIQAAAAAGLRRLEAVESLAMLIESLEKTNSVVRREIEKTVLAFCRETPAMVLEEISNLVPRHRFQIVRLLSADKSAGAQKIMNKLKKDEDSRISSAAGYVLSAQRDQIAPQEKDKQEGKVPNKLLEKLTGELLDNISR